MWRDDLVSCPWEPCADWLNEIELTAIDDVAGHQPAQSDVIAHRRARQFDRRRVPRRRRREIPEHPEDAVEPATEANRALRLLTALDLHVERIPVHLGCSRAVAAVDRIRTARDHGAELVAVQIGEPSTGYRIEMNSIIAELKRQACHASE